MIGFSLSLCVRDIIDGKVNLDAVEKIVTGTCYRERGEFIAGIDATYCRTYWRRSADEAFVIAVLLWDAGKLDQPRLRGEEPPHGINGGGNHWKE